MVGTRQIWQKKYVGSPPRRQHRNEATTGLLRGYYESYYEATTGLLRGYYVATTRLLQGYYQATTNQATTRLLRGYYQEPPARHSASSTAAAAPLVCRRRSSRQLGSYLTAGVVTQRTNSGDASTL